MLKKSILCFKQGSYFLEIMLLIFYTDLILYMLGTQDLKNSRVSYYFLSFYSVFLKLGTKKELVILKNPMFFVFEIFAFLAGK